MMKFYFFLWILFSGLAFSSCSNTGSPEPVVSARSPYVLLTDSVAISFFTGSPNTSSTGIRLVWRAEQEFRNLGFILRRAENNIPFRTIASYLTNTSLRGRGTTTVPFSYSYDDTLVIPNTNYTYLLQSVDSSSIITTRRELTVFSGNPRDPNIPRTTSFVLQQNYPNPFNSTTTIQYSIPTASRVVLTFTDQDGIPVVLIDYGEKAAGNYSNSINLAGLASGVYFYTLTAGSFIQTKKMLLIK
jgi:hypothetical protein